jgi:hypothetical protein
MPGENGARQLTVDKLNGQLTWQGHHRLKLPTADPNQKLSELKHRAFDSPQWCEVISINRILRHYEAKTGLNGGLTSAE